jgi:hypothetical protein
VVFFFPGYRKKDYGEIRRECERERRKLISASAGEREREGSWKRRDNAIRAWKVCCVVA